VTAPAAPGPSSATSFKNLGRVRREFADKRGIASNRTLHVQGAAGLECFK